MAMTKNGFWTDEEKAIVDQAVKGEITANEMAALLSHRSSKGINKQFVRRSRALGKPKQNYNRTNISFGLAPDDPGWNDNWEKLNEQAAVVGSAKLLMAISRAYPDRVAMC